MNHYLNNAGAAIMSPVTIATIQRHLDRETQIGGYQAAAERDPDIRHFYESVAILINGLDASNIAFMDSASRAWNMALYGMPIQHGDLIVTLSSEFGTNLVSLYHFANKVGARVRVVNCDARGHFDLSEIETGLKQGARLVAISHAAAHGSIVNPVEDIGKLAAAYDALYLVDGCQSVGQIAIDVQAIGCHAYTGTGRKWLRGPRGTGFLYVKSDAPISPLYVDLASADLTFADDNKTPNGVNIRQDACRFELWERSVAGVLGLGVAIQEYLELDKMVAFSRMQNSSRMLRESVAQRADLHLLGEVCSPSSVVGFYLLDPSKEAGLRERFASEGVQISTMGDWDCPLHFPRNGAKSIFRLSAHYYTPDATIELAKKIIDQFK